MPQSNPFTPTFGATPPLMVERDGIISRVERAIEAGPHHPDYTLLLTGRRGTGKTALLDAVEAAVRERGWQTVSVTASIGELAARIDEQLAHSGGPSTGTRLRSVQALGFGASWDDSAEPAAPGTPSLRSLLAAAATALDDDGLGLLVTLDEFHAVDASDARELAVALQHVTRRERRPVALVAAALPEVEDTVMADPGMTFFHRCARGTLETLSYAASKQALQVPIEQAGGRIENEALTVAVEATGGYPYMVQLVGFHAWEACANPGGTLTLADVHEGIYQADGALVDALLAPQWAKLSATDRDVLRLIAAGDGPVTVAHLADVTGQSASYVNNYRSRLLRAGAITAPARGVVDVRDPAMRRWLTGLRPIPEFPHN